MLGKNVIKNVQTTMVVQ